MSNILQDKFFSLDSDIPRVITHHDTLGGKKHKTKGIKQNLTCPCYPDIKVYHNGKWSVSRGRDRRRREVKKLIRIFGKTSQNFMDMMDKYFTNKWTGNKQ